MYALTVFYLTMSAVALVAAAFSIPAERWHAIQCAATLALMCACANATWITRNWWTWPMQDSAFVWFVAIRYRMAPRRWKLGLMMFAIIKLFAHVEWQLGDKSEPFAYAYTLTLNLLFLGQLACVAFGGRGVAGLVRYIMGAWTVMRSNRGNRLVRLKPERHRRRVRQ